VVLPTAAHAGPLLMRHAIHAAGWRKVYGRVHGSTFAVYASEAFKVPELEVECSGARLSELDAKGGMFTKKGGLFRFDITPSAAGGAAGKQRGAAEKGSEQRGRRQQGAVWAVKTARSRALAFWLLIYIQRGLL
jgi:hypothetical protein